MSLAHLGGVGAEEQRRHGDDLIAPHAVVDGQVMSLHSPAPGVVTAGIAEHGPVVQLRVAYEGDLVPFPFQGTQYQLVLHDEVRLPVGLLGEAGGHQLQGRFALLLVHVAQRQAMAVERRVVPEDALAVQVMVGGFVPLGVVQAGQETPG